MLGNLGMKCSVMLIVDTTTLVNCMVCVFILLFSYNDFRADQQDKK